MNDIENKNTELIYQYTNELLKSKIDSIIRLETKVGVVLGFSGLFLKFAATLHSIPIKQESINKLQDFLLLTLTPEGECLILKILSYLFIVFCGIICLYALSAKTRGSIIDPKELMKNEFYERSDQKNKEDIIEAWIDFIDECDEVGNFKRKMLNIALLFIFFAGVAIVGNITISSLFIL